MSNVIRVIAAVVDKYNLTLYKEDGTEHIIKQGDPELHRVLGIVMPIIQDGGVAEVEIGQSADKGKEFTDFEAKTNGFVKFFKVMKAEAEKFLTQLGANTDHVAPLTLGKVPTKNPAVASVVVKRKDETKETEAQAKKAAAVAEVLANAVPTSSEQFSAPKADQHDEKGKLVTEGQETMIAVVDGVAIPGVEKLSGQFEYANRDGNSTVGMENFLKRLAAVIQQRGHSVEDLLKFLERGDLPIADDGCFVAYKILRKKYDQKDVYVDCHTRLVPQKVGSYVHMDHALVDPNRRNECSNGLHVARRGYIGNFSGDVCTLIKVRPEDVIAVPQYDANKMRVCGYHIIDLIADADYRKLCRDNAMTDNMAAKVQLGKALAGDHIGIIENVKIGGHAGTNITVTPVVAKAEAKKAKKVAEKRTAEAIKEKPVKKNTGAAPVDAKAIAKQVTAQKAAGGSARQTKANELFEAFNKAENPRETWAAAKALVDFKKAAKVSWEKLGITVLVGEYLVATAATEPVFQEPEAVAVAPARKKSTPAKSTGVRNTFEAKGTPPVNDREAKLRGLMLRVAKGDKPAATEALIIKRKAKKSWEALGLTKADGEKIVKLAAK